MNKRIRKKRHAMRIRALWRRAVEEDWEFKRPVMETVIGPYYAYTTITGLVYGPREKP